MKICEISPRRLFWLHVDVFQLAFCTAVYRIMLQYYLTSSPELMQRKPRSARQACTARMTASNLLLSLYKRRRLFSFTSAILPWLSISFPGSAALAWYPRQSPKSAGNFEFFSKVSMELLRLKMKIATILSNLFLIERGQWSERKAMVETEVRQHKLKLTVNPMKTMLRLNFSRAPPFCTETSVISAHRLCDGC